MDAITGIGKNIGDILKTLESPKENHFFPLQENISTRKGMTA
ncbi:MAG: hypothetical protein AB2L14_32525 [Candidatus Xenobiia bacterium LiM19]